MDDLKSQLSALTGRTTAAKLRALMPEIVAKVEAGVSHDEIIETLNASGFDLKLTTFRSNLYRYRQKQSQDAPALPQTSPPHPSNSDRQTGRDPEPITDGNPQSEVEAPEPETSPELEGTLSDILDPKKRDALTDRYFQKPALIGRKRSKSE